MALLGTCWLIIEFFVIPDGFLKLFYLSFYIHPTLLVFLQIFLWLKELQKWIFFFFCFLFRIICYLSSFIFGFKKRVAVFLLSVIRPTKGEVLHDVMDRDEFLTQDYEFFVSRSTSNSIYLHVNESRSPSNVFELINDRKVSARLNIFEAKGETGQYNCKGSWLNEYLNSDHYSDCTPITNDHSILSSLEFLEHGTSTSPSSSFSDQEFDSMINNSDVDFLQSVPESLEGLICFNSSCKIEDSEIDYPVEVPIMSQEDRALPCSIVDVRAPLFPTDDQDNGTLRTADWSVEEYLPIYCGSNSPTVELDQPLVISRSMQEDTDSFHQMYIARMRFFDVLYQERLLGMKILDIAKEVLNYGERFHSCNLLLIRLTDAILKEHLASPSSISSTLSNFSSGRVETTKIMKSLESDLELVHVAQTCLSWEALHHQYRKLEAFACSDNSEDQRLFCIDAAERFRKFQILLERFMDDEKPSEGRGKSNYIRRRCQLHVPDVTGPIEESISMGGEAIRASEVLYVIYKCIEAFWTYVGTDKKNTSWKFKAILWSHPPVEDPRDLELLYNLSKALQKKMQYLNHLQGKKKGWLRRRVKPLQSESVKKNVLFATIDLKLVEMVLNMSIISTSHLKWCQEKLKSLEFKQGKIFRSPISCLFPSSS